jgi:FkbM family methyltransferase
VSSDIDEQPASAQHTPQEPRRVAIVLEGFVMGSIPGGYLQLKALPPQSDRRQRVGFVFVLKLLVPHSIAASCLPLLEPSKTGPPQLRIGFTFLRLTQALWQWFCNATPLFLRGFPRFVFAILQPVQAIYRRLIEPLRAKLKERRRLRDLDLQNFEKLKRLLRDTNYVYEKELFLVPELLKPRTTVFDIGANDGVYTRRLSGLVGPQGRVVSVEPGKRAFAALRKLVRSEKLENVHLHRAAVGSACGRTSLYVPDYTKVAQIQSADPIEGRKETVSVTTVDDLVRHHQIQALSFLKVDVEGAELLVLAGAQATLARFRPNLLMEIADVHLARFGTSGQKILEHLWALGYRSFEFVWETRKLKPIQQITLKGGHTWSRLDEDLATNNYIFIPGDKIDPNMVCSPAGSTPVATQ